VTGVRARLVASESERFSGKLGESRRCGSYPHNELTTKVAFESLEFNSAEQMTLWKRFERARQTDSALQEAWSQATSQRKKRQQLAQWCEDRARMAGKRSQVSSDSKASIEEWVPMKMMLDRFGREEARARIQSGSILTRKVDGFWEFQLVRQVRTLSDDHRQERDVLSEAEEETKASKAHKASGSKFPMKLLDEDEGEKAQAKSSMLQLLDKPASESEGEEEWKPDDTKPTKVQTDAKKRKVEEAKRLEPKKKPKAKATAKEAAAKATVAAKPQAKAKAKAKAKPKANAKAKPSQEEKEKTKVAKKARALRLEVLEFEDMFLKLKEEMTEAASEKKDTSPTTSALTEKAEEAAKDIRQIIKDSKNEALVCVKPRYKQLVADINDYLCKVHETERKGEAEGEADKDEAEEERAEGEADKDEAEEERAEGEADKDEAEEEEEEADKDKGGGKENQEEAEEEEPHTQTEVGETPRKLDPEAAEDVE
jgi:hypothetical protein